ncbi:FHA domain-containing protein [Nostoc sp. 'Lobaria pulmonaria (5183) cyanobiont']|uniref:FHA domain-containing protein n=1 Tax=Nostoc sp. 'Lobaria pulmonaria (5183) cyanobiont' TaxID=1618022 RepID=UPI000CF33CC5|nr:FHA domain-containing protein [Nostoc sp. 'Lobaria pulmonaria (5183) cyanobiont']AVH70600.1 FHA domain-containing protein [Nostoc sp. 'Lobaria pulmonaria (5183) cyanobiont']
MLVCPNCNHPNPDGAVQCEACYTPLPATTNCPSCGATVQADAAFCGQCGYNLHSAGVPHVHTAVAATVTPDIPVEVPALAPPDPLLELLQPDALGISGSTNSHPPESSLPPTEVAVPPEPAPQVPVTVSSPPEPPPTVVAQPVVSGQSSIPTPPPVEPAPASEIEAKEPAAPASTATAARTQLQQVTARLIHVQSDRLIELPQNFSVIHIGKPNDRIPPDIDVSGFPNSEIVSRIHADIRVEGDAHYVEDVGSSNGTYINNLPLLPGNRHRLRPGDRISLGKGDLMTFLFQLA